MRQTTRRTQRNAITKRRFRELTKQFLSLIEEKKLEDAAKLFPQVQKAIDLAAKKNILHKNNAARKKSSLAKMIAKSGVAKVKAPVETPTKKPAAKKKASSKKD